MSRIYALLSVIRQQMSTFDPFRGGGHPKRTMSPFLSFFLMQGLPLPPMIETSLSSWLWVKARFSQWARKPLPTTRKRNLRNIDFLFWHSWRQPGQPEQVEILPCESLLHKIGHCSLQSLTHANLSEGMPSQDVKLEQDLSSKPFLPPQLQAFPHTIWNLKDVHLMNTQHNQVGQQISCTMVGRTNKEESCINGPNI